MHPAIAPLMSSKPVESVPTCRVPNCPQPDLLAASGLTGLLRPLPVIRSIGVCYCQARMQVPCINPGSYYSAGIPDSIRRWVGDLMEREWNVPVYTEVKVLGSGGFAR